MTTTLKSMRDYLADDAGVANFADGGQNVVLLSDYEDHGQPAVVVGPAADGEPEGCVRIYFRHATYTKSRVLCGFIQQRLDALPLCETIERVQYPVPFGGRFVVRAGICEPV